MVQLLNWRTHELRTIETLSTPSDLPISCSNCGFEGDTLHYVRRDPSGKELILVRHDLTTHEKKQKVIWPESSAPPPVGFGLNLKDNFLEYIRSRTNGTVQTESLRRRELDSGRETELFHSTNRVSIRSPWRDKERVGILEMGRSWSVQPVLHVFDAKDGRTDERFTVTLPERSRITEWLWDNSRRLVFLKQTAGTDADDVPEVWTVSGENGELQKTKLAMPRITNISRSKDSETILVQQNQPLLRQIWVMENFLPSVPSTK